MELEPHSPRKHEVYYGWVIVGVVALASFSQTAETFPVWSVLLKPMTEEFGWSRSEFTGAMTIGTVIGAITAVGFGPMLDRYGPRWSVAAALGVVGASLLLMPLISTLWHFYALLVLGRVMHIGLIGIALSVITPKWFIAKRGRAVAFTRLGNRLGSTVTPLYAQILISALSWRAAVATVGGVVWLVSMVPAAIFLRRQPEDMGLLPDGATQEEMEAYQQQDPATSRATRRPVDVSISVHQVIRLPSFYLLAGAYGFAFLVGPATSLHLMPYLTDQGMSAAVAVTAVAVSSASGGAGALAFGFLVERFNSQVILAADFVLIAVAFLLLQGVTSGPLALAWGIYYGAVHGGMFTLLQIIFADHYGRHSLGAIRGLMSPLQATMHALGPMGAAVAYDVTGSYGLVFFGFAAATLAAAGCVFVARPPTVGQPTAVG